LAPRPLSELKPVSRDLIQLAGDDGAFQAVGHRRPLPQRPSALGGRGRPDDFECPAVRENEAAATQRQPPSDGLLPQPSASLCSFNRVYAIAHFSGFCFCLKCRAGGPVKNSRPRNRVSGALISMCGRYRRTTSEEELARRYHIPIPKELDLPISYNIAPSEKVLTIRFNPQTQQRSLDALQWGLVPYWANDPKMAYNTD
jgi:hypothetical protein